MYICMYIYVYIYIYIGAGADVGSRPAGVASANAQRSWQVFMYYRRVSLTEGHP